MKRYILFLFISLLTFSLHAQNIDVTGTVIGESDQEPIIGAYVKVKGSTAGAVTDLNGTYMLKGVSGKATLVISCVGYATQEIPVKDRHTLNITLKDEASDLNEVVVIGYGAVKKGDLTSSISAIKGDKLEHMSTGNVMNALQGQVNGVQISNAGGPGASPRVIIRGISTINGSDPLYVVDGMPVGTNINFLNQNDIESMQVLKDASASAIYGTRGSNGVILITTKKGAAGKTKFNASATWGFQTLSKPDIAGADEYRQVFNTRYTNDGHTSIFNETSDDGRSSLGNTDWWDETMRDVALQQNYTVTTSISIVQVSDTIVKTHSIRRATGRNSLPDSLWNTISIRWLKPV